MFGRKGEFILSASRDSKLALRCKQLPARENEELNLKAKR